MKKPKVFRLRLLVGRLLPGRSRRRGVAIITVLAIVSLMTVLIISFFNMAQATKTSAIGTVEMQRVVTLKDTAINLVMGQIREATTLQGSGNTQTLWTSQPGAIRTFHGSNTELNRLYKLYSSDKMMIGGIQKDGSAALLNEIEGDIESKWDEYPDVYVDLNRPVVPSNAARDADSPVKLRERLIYPIVDPSRYNGQDTSKTENTEGFTYGESELRSGTINGVDARKGQLSMPVKWIYLLEDGSPGTVDKEGKFIPLSKEGKAPTKDNQIVSRIAWWTDDETCKINVNTASLPIPWDTPRTNSAEDVWYAQFQPVSGEVQHYPSHPAQTDLCAVLFPGYRYTPDSSIFPVGELMNPLPQNYAQLIWNIAPFVTGTGGTEGGTRKVIIGTAKPVALDLGDHLYPTFEELYFKAKDEEKNLNRARDTVSREDQGSKMLSRLEGSSFFLTTRSSGPEMTIYGTPRLCMFPMNENVLAEVGKTSGQVNPKVGAFEVTMATNSTIAKKPYYFQRTDAANSRHNAFFAQLAGRNAQLLRYMLNLTESIPPGHPELPATFNTFYAKYPGPNRTAGDNPNKDFFDSSDRTQILLSMLDMLRSTNMSPGYLQSGSAYDSGLGQVSGICGCNVVNNSDPQPRHTTALAYNAPYYTPKGSGRTYGPAEICLFAHAVATKKGNNTSAIPQGIRLSPTAQTKWNEAKAASLIQVGVLVNAFSPRQGWSPLFAEAGVNISGRTAASASDPRSPAGVQAPIFFAGSSQESRMLTGLDPDGYNPAANAGANPPIPMPPGFVPWAGVSGARMMATRKVATLDPLVYEGPGAGEPNAIPVQLKWVPGDILRIFLYDDPQPSNFNVIQGVDLDIGAGTIEMNVEFTGSSIETLLQQSMGSGPNSFPPPKVAMTSFVVPHGDYRLTTTPLRVERGIFVPHGTGAHSVVEPILQGRNVTYQKYRGAVLAPQNDQLLSGQGIPPMNEAYAPHFAPVNQEYLCRPDLGTRPTDPVLSVASANPNRRLRFAHGRRDGQYRGPQYQPYSTANTIPNRGSSDPLETGDFDQGVGLCPAGAYMNQPDDGDARDANYPYYATLNLKSKVNPASFSPNRLLRSAVDFGSIPNGLQARVPWQTLRFRPDPGMGKAQNIYQGVAHTPQPPDGYDHVFPFSNYCGPKDHLLLDMFWVPVVEPWSISEGFATKGMINLNQQIYPFTYINRTTALHALLRSERMMAIPDSAGNTYKDGSTLGNKTVYRHWINAKETLKQLVNFRWRGQDAEGFTLPFNAFRSASEICELWLVPEKNGSGNEGGGTWDLNYTIREFWKTHRLTGDNMRERPYSNLYPRLTTRSNVYKVHMIAQTLKKASSNAPDVFNSQYERTNDPDTVTAEWRGSALIERVINPNDPDLVTSNVDYAAPTTPTALFALPKLDNYYSYRVTEVKQLTE